MKLFLILLAILSSLLPFGCTHVVTSEIPVRLSQVKTNYWVLDGLPYFLPKPKVHVDITWSKDENNWIVNVKPAIQPDDKSQFILRADSNALFDDDVTLSVDQNGLLQTVNVMTTDKTVASIADLVAAIGNVFTFGAGLGPSIMTKKKIETEAQLQCSYHGDFDLNKNRDEIKLQTPPMSKKVMIDKRDSAGKLVKDENGKPIQEPQDIPVQYSTKFKLEFKYLGTPPTDKETPQDAYPIRGIVEESPEILAIHGIVVRTPVPYEFNVTVDNNTTQSTFIMLPDVKQTYILPINRRYLVQDKTNVTLKDGMIQSIQQVRPSMVAGIVGIPKSILSALVPIPLQIRQSQTSNLQAIDSSLKLKKEIKELQSQ